MIGSRNIQKWVFTWEISSGRIIRDVRIKCMRRGCDVHVTNLGKVTLGERFLR